MSDDGGIVTKVEHGLEGHILGVPAWALVAGVVGAAGIYFVFFRKAPAGSSTPGIGGSPIVGAGGGDGGLGPSGPATPPPPPPAGANDDWLLKVVDQVAQATGMDDATVKYYLQLYLNGGSPNADAHAYSAFEKAIASALQLGGNPPVHPASSNPSYSGFLTPTDWLNAGFNELGTVDEKSANELRLLFAGQSSTIGETAARFLQAMFDIFGVPVGMPAFTVVADPPGAPPPPQPPNTQESTVAALLARYQMLLAQYKRETDPGRRNQYAQALAEVWAEIQGLHTQ